VRTLHFAASALAVGITLTGATSISLRAEPTGPLAALLERARTNYAEGAYRDAIRDFALAAESTPSPESLAALVGLVRSAVRSADYQLAYEHSARLAQLAPADATALATHADGFWAIGQFDRSEAIALEAVRLDPRHPRALHALARARFALGHVDEARAHLESALVRDPSDADLFYSLGLLERRAGRSSAAAAAFRKFLTLTPKRDRTARVVWADTEVGLLDALGDRPSELSEPNAVETVDLRLAGDDKLVVRVAVNGGAEVDAILDTGAERPSIDQDYARGTAVRLVHRPGLQGTRTVGAIETLSMGRLRARRVSCLMRSRGAPPIVDRVRNLVSPLALGLSMTVDYRSRKLTIGRVLPDEPADIVLPLRYVHLPVATGMVDGRPASFVVDTGAFGATLSRHVAGALAPDRVTLRRPLKLLDASGRPDPHGEILLPRFGLALGSLTVQAPTMVVRNLDEPSAYLGFQIDGLIGHRVLEHHRVTFDLSRGVLKLQRNR
jgi:tetratricopeptide (TPR) repeat protein